MKKIILAFIILISSSLFDSCAIQEEVEIFRERQEKTERFSRPKHTVRDGLFSKNRKLKIRHRYFYRNNDGEWYFRPTPEWPDFVHYKRTGRVWGTKGKVRIIKRGTVAVKTKKKTKRR